MAFKSFVNNSFNKIKGVLNDIKENKPFFIQTGPNTDSLLESGALVDMERGMFDSFEPKKVTASNMTPKSVVLVKKKAFSSLNVNNDLRWMDKTEKFLLRATKALFAYKVQQIRAYESLSKYNDFYDEYNLINLNLLYSFYGEFNKATAGKISESELAFLKATKGNDIEGKRADIMDLLKRNAFALENHMTTWIVDSTNIENYSTGPGTGVIELGLYSSFSCSTGIQSSAKSASITLQDPYNISVITEDDINFAIEEAFYGTFELFKSLIDGTYAVKNSFDQYPSINSSELASIALNAAGFKDADRALDIEYVRERLRVFYLGKPYINPADTVHFYISTRKSKQKYSSSSDHYVDDSFMQINDSVLEAERILYTNKKITFEEYKRIRQYSDSSFEMSHIFAGFVSSTSSSYSSGQYTLSVSVQDNMGWLSWSRYAQIPGLQDYVGTLEDPLTPFRYRTDELGNIVYPEGLELLDENRVLLDAGLLSYNSGLFKGQNATQNNLFQQEFNDFGSLKGTKVLQHPDGFIYRWKSGIQAVVADFQAADPTGNSFRESKVFGRKYGITATNDVLNNLDVANILSVLITGQPYNTETFLQRAYEAHNISNLSTNLNPYDPLTTVLQSLKKQNYYYGNFKPYRMITMNKRSIQKQIADVSLKSSINGNLKKIQKRKFQILRQIEKIKSNIVNPELNAADNVLIATLENELFSLEKTITEQLNVAENSGLLEEKDLLTLELNFFKSNADLNLSEESERNENLTRAMMKVGALRRIEDVRLNRDKNLFIVSDQYDYNVDLRPFLLNIKKNNYKLFDSQYVDTLQSCTAANNIINFEFFCNSQGHIEFRPPGWNKTPLSVLKRYLTLDKKKNTKYIPEYITKIFENRIDSLETEIQSLNVSVVLASLLLGRFPDKNLIPGMKLIGKSSLSFFGIASSADKSSEDQSTKNDLGRLNLSFPRSRTHISPSSKFELNAQISFVDGKPIMGDSETMLGEFDAIFQEKSSVFNDILSTIASPNLSPARKYANAENLNRIRDEFLQKTGKDPGAILGFSKKKFKAENFIFYKNSEEDLENNSLYQKLLSDKNILSKIKQIISSRDRLVTVLIRNKEKQKELEQVENIFDGATKSEDPENADDLFGGFQKNLENTKEALDKKVEYINYLNESAFKGSVYDYLIEDDTTNILGYGSGKRFIIDDDDIVSANYQENPPEFTRISVKGDAPLNLGQKLSSFSDGLYFFAGATDFDLWRQYGYKAKEIPAPFLSDSEGQCKPYALFQLQKQRVNINKASITVVGNEFYQPGDVVYVSSKNLLYYVESVNHQFNIGSTFNTQLTLSFGRPPGVYLPGPLDIIGQQFSTDPLKDRVLNYRNVVGDDEYRPLQPYSSIIVKGKSFIGREPTKEDVLSDGDNQSRFGNMMIDLQGTMSSKNTYLLLRTFVNSEPQERGESIDVARRKLNLVKDMFVNPQMVDVVNDDEVTLLDGVDFGISDDLKDISKSISPIKKLSPLLLPNSLQPSPIPSGKILLQISFLKKPKAKTEEEKYITTGRVPADLEEGQFAVGSSELDDLYNDNISKDLILCLDSNLADQILDENGNIKNPDSTLKIGNASTSAKALFPSGGPTQSTWLDLRDLFGYGLSGWGNGAVSDLVEIGIIDISRALKGK